MHFSSSILDSHWCFEQFSIDHPGKEQGQRSLRYRIGFPSLVFTLRGQNTRKSEAIAGYMNGNLGALDLNEQLLGPLPLVIRPR